MACSSNQFTISECLDRAENITSDDESDFDILNLEECEASGIASDSENDEPDDNTIRVGNSNWTKMQTSCNNFQQL